MLFYLNMKKRFIAHFSLKALWLVCFLFCHALSHHACFGYVRKHIVWEWVKNMSSCPVDWTVSNSD